MVVTLLAVVAAAGASWAAAARGTRQALSTCVGEPFSTAFFATLQHGTLVAVSLPPVSSGSPPFSREQLAELMPLAELHEQELDFLLQMRAPQRQLGFAGGRIALRRALYNATCGEDEGCQALLANELGAPAMPGSLLGSISHTDGLAIALVSRPDALEHDAAPLLASESGVTLPTSAIGVDVESIERSPLQRIERRVLAPEERLRLRRGELASVGLCETKELLLRFSIKEARCETKRELRHERQPRELRAHGTPSTRSRATAAPPSDALCALFRMPLISCTHQHTSTGSCVPPLQALYKAIHPLLRTSIEWHSVTADPKADGSCAVDATVLADIEGVALHAEASWTQRDNFVISTAVAHLLPPEHT